MIVTAVKDITGVWGCHEEGQRPVDGVAVYRYRGYWKCEQHGAFIPRMQTTPCFHVQAVIAKEAAK